MDKQRVERKQDPSNFLIADLRNLYKKASKNVSRMGELWREKGGLK